MRDLLADGKWKEADRETKNKMLEVMGRQQQGYLTEEDLKNFPCKDLRTIDQLWVHYSDGRFGFSLQKRIWIEEGGKPGIYDKKVYEKFGDRVGWRVNNEWKNSSDLTFTSNAYPGHFPTEVPYRLYFFPPVLGGVVGFSSLASRLVIYVPFCCKIAGDLVGSAHPTCCGA